MDHWIKDADSVDSISLSTLFLVASKHLFVAKQNPEVPYIPRSLGHQNSQQFEEDDEQQDEDNSDEMILGDSQWKFIKPHMTEKKFRGKFLKVSSRMDKITSSYTTTTAVKPDNNNSNYDRDIDYDDDDN
jgi:hypothetical protein